MHITLRKFVGTMTIEPFYDAATGSLSYLVVDDATQCCAVIDPVLDFDPASGEVNTRSADAILKTIQSRALTLTWVLETHVHADHLTAAQYLRDATGAPVAIGEGIRKVRTLFDRVLNTSKNELSVDVFFDRLLEDGDVVAVGDLRLSVLATPGHTPACVSYYCDGAVFVGDTLFRPDYGTARTDFPGGDAGVLFDSIRRLLELPPSTRFYFCHDYPNDQSGAYTYVSELEEQLKQNVQLKGRSREEFIAFRCKRDRGLATPRLLYPSIQVNLRAGQFPDPESNGQVYLKQPLVLP